MKTPGHAMTAQAGAEECDECGMMCSPNEYHPYAACLMFKGCQRGDIVRANLPTPPAAVPVEALKGLMAGLEDSIAHNDESDDWLRGAKTTAQFIRDELTQLIKERSNG